MTLAAWIRSMLVALAIWLATVSCAAKAEVLGISKSGRLVPKAELDAEPPGRIEVRRKSDAEPLAGSSLARVLGYKGRSPDKRIVQPDGSATYVWIEPQVFYELGPSEYHWVAVFDQRGSLVECGWGEALLRD